MLRGLITWQWAPDRRPARQAGQLLSLTRLGSIFQTGRPAPPHACKIRQRAPCASTACALVQAFLAVWETHQPLAFTDLPGNSWQGPYGLALGSV